MSDNEYNNNHNEEKDPWGKPSKNEQAEAHTEESAEPKQETAAQPEQNWQDVSSGQTEEPKDEEPTAEEQPAAPDEPTAEQPAANPHQQPGQYQNSQNPYSPYGQYNNPYGQYNNPYGNYNNPYGTYGQNGQTPYQQQGQYNSQGQQYWTYQQYGGQYQQQNGQQPKQPKRKNTGLRVFLWILGILVAGSVLGFCVYGVYTAIDQKENTPNNTTSQAQQGNGGYGNNGGAGSSSSSQAQIQGGVSGNGTNPNSTGIVINSTPSGSALSAKEVYKNVVESVVGVETTISDTATGQSGVGQGTGIIATSDGYILTNAHVVNYSRSNQVKVVLHNSKQYAATVVGYDKTSDIAVLKINATNLTPATFGNAAQLEVGDQVIAIGNPGGLSYASSLTGGYVSALDRSIETHSDNGMTYIQTDAAINPGNSGGPLVNMYGQVVGINSNKIVATGYEGMGFAIPVSKAKTIIDQLIAHGYVSGRSRLGITAGSITAAQAELTGLPAGVIIREIGADSDLRNSNVVVGDIITKADGQALTSLDDLYAVLNNHKAGETITLTIVSPSASGGNGTTRQVKTKLLEDKGETQAQITK